MTSFSRRDYAAAAVLALAVVVGASIRMVPGVIGVIDDDAVYAVTAKSLAVGDGYHLTSTPGNPPQTKYPVLYPALLSVAWHAGSSDETRLWAMQCATTAMAAVALAMAYLYCVRFQVGARMSVFAACLLLATTSNFLFFSSQTLSETPFLALLVAALWAGEERLRAPREDRSHAFGEKPRRRPVSAAWGDVLLGVILVLPLLCRTAGIVVPPVVVGLFVLSRRPVRWIVCGVLLASVPWFAWMLHGTAAAQDALLGYQTDYLDWWLRHGSFVVPIQNVLFAGLAFAHIQFEALSYAMYPRVDPTRWILFPIGALPWLLLVLRRRSLPALLPATLWAYLALLCVWPWPPARFLVPVFPFLTTLLFEAFRRAVVAVGGARAGAATLAVVVAAAVISNVEMMSRYTRARVAGGYPYFALTDAPVRWQQYQAAFEWLRGHSKETDVLAAGFDTMTSLYTGRPTIRPFVLRPLSMFYGDSSPKIGDVAEMREFLVRYHARYMFLSPLPAYNIEEEFFELVYGAMDAGILRPVWQAKDDDRFVIFEVVAPPPTDS